MFVQGRNPVLQKYLLLYTLHVNGKYPNDMSTLDIHLHIINDWTGNGKSNIFSLIWCKSLCSFSHSFHIPYCIYVSANNLCFTSVPIIFHKDTMFSSFKWFYAEQLLLHKYLTVAFLISMVYGVDVIQWQFSSEYWCKLPPGCTYSLSDTLKAVHTHSTVIIKGCTTANRTTTGTANSFHT